MIHSHLPRLIAALLLFSVACSFDEEGLAIPGAGQKADAAPEGGDAATGELDGAAGGPDAAPGAPDAAIGEPDAAYGVEVGEVACGPATCASPQVCCVTRGGIGDDPTSECTGAEACPQGAAIACDGPEDCAGPDEVCCGSIGLDTSTSCEQASACFVAVCHAADDCPGASDQCCATDLGAGYCSGLGCL